MRIRKIVTPLDGPNTETGCLPWLRSESIRHTKRKIYRRVIRGSGQSQEAPLHYFEVLGCHDLYNSTGLLPEGLAYLKQPPPEKARRPPKSEPHERMRQTTTRTVAALRGPWSLRSVWPRLGELQAAHDTAGRVRAGVARLGARGPRPSCAGTQLYKQACLVHWRFLNNFNEATDEWRFRQESESRNKLART